MPNYQTSRATSSNLVTGNYKIEVAQTTVGGSYTNLGAGMVNSWGYTPEYYDIQSGNSPDPVEGISTEAFSVDMELIEFDLSVLTAIMGGAITGATGGTVYTVTGGGNVAISPKIFKLTNTSTVSGSAKTLIVTLFRCFIKSGFQVTAKSDNDADPINVMPITISAEVDTTLTAGSQLFSIVKQV